jgi:hypothetical protein
MADQFTAGETFTEDEQVTHTKLNLAQTNLKFASAAVDDSTTAISSEAIIVKSGGIAATQLATNAVTEVKILNGAVTADKLGADCVSAAKIADNAINSEHYVDGSIDKEHLGANVISGQTELAAIPVLTEDEILISDNGVLKKLNLMRYLPLPRAFGHIVTSGSPSQSDAQGLYGCTCSAYSGNTYEFTFSGFTMASSTVYTVIAQDHDTRYIREADDDADTTAVEIDGADKFSVHRAKTGSMATSFVVFGTLAT